MNGDLISREALLDTISECYDDAAVYDSHMREVIERHCYYAADLVREAPAVDAEPVVHGRWIDSEGAIRCSECLHTPLYDYHGRLKLSKACPTCGANMWKERGE